MLLLSLLLGITIAILGALPPGASNLAVIQTTLQQNHHESLKISYGAGIGEVLLVLIAFSSGMVVQDFFKMNVWVQYLAAGLLAGIGIFFIVRTHKKPKSSKGKSSKYLLGFMLSIVNPPVLIYWILVFSFLGNYMFLATDNSLLWMLFFTSGVFVGKVTTLYGYSKLGLKLQQKKPSNKVGINRFIGVTLLVLSCIQITKLAFL